MSSIGDTTMSERISSRASLLFQQKREFFEAVHQPPPPMSPIPDTPPGHSSERMSRFDFPMDTNPRRGSSVPTSSSSRPPVPPPKPKRTFAFDVWMSEQLEKEAKTGKLAKLSFDELTLEERIIIGYWDEAKKRYVKHPPEINVDQGIQSTMSRRRLVRNHFPSLYYGRIRKNATDGPSTSGTSTSQMISKFERLSSDSKNGGPPKKFERKPTRPEVLEGVEEKIVELKAVNGNNCTILETGTISPMTPCETPIVLKSPEENHGQYFAWNIKRQQPIRGGRDGKKVSDKKQRAKEKEGEQKTKRKERAELIRKETLENLRIRNEEDTAAKKQMLFDTALIVSITRIQNDDGTHNHSPNITYCFGEFPANGSKCIDNICHIVYPDIDHATQLKRGNHRNDSCDHSFFVALTDELGGRTYAYCIKFEPVHSDTEPFYFPSVLALLTRTRDPSFFFELAKKALVHIGDRIRLSSFLSTVHKQEHPRKGGSLIVMQRDAWGLYGKRTEIHCSFGCDKKMKMGWGVNDLVRLLHPEWVVAIIAACLGQQRIIITGSNVHDVTRAVNAIDALLRPLEWPFSFIPCIPDVITEVTETPTPYLFGLLRHNLGKISHLVIEDLGNDEQKSQTDFVMFDIDRGLINPVPFTVKNHKHFAAHEIGHFRHMTDVEREAYIRRKNCFSYCKSVGMPRKVAKNLITHFYNALEKEKSEYDIESCTEAMLIWYASLFGHVKSTGAFTEWNEETKKRLVEKQPHPPSRDFLEIFAESSLMELWVHRRVTGYNVAKILGDTARNMIKFMQNMLIYWEITAISDPSPGFLTLSKMNATGRLILPAEELEMIDAIFSKFCEDVDYKRKKPVKAAFKQLFGSSRRN